MKTRSYQKILSFLLALFMCCFAGFIISTTNSDAKAAGDQTLVFEIEGAEVRSDAPAGIRFVTNVSKDFYDTHSGETFGTLIIPTNLLGENEVLSLQTAKALNIVTKNWKVQPGSGDTYQYTSTLIGKDLSTQLPVAEWNRKLTAISYVWDGEDIESAVYSNAEERSLAEVAAGVLASGEIDTEEEGFLKTICDTVIGENTLAFNEGTSITKKDLEETITLTLTGNQGLKAIYTSNNADITVDANGVVSATAYGTATITATIGNKTASIEVTYKEPTLTTLSFNQESIELYASHTLYGTYYSYFSMVDGTGAKIENDVNNSIPVSEVLTVLDEDDDPIDLSDVDISYTVDNERGAKVENGKIYAGSVQYARTATVTATANGLSDTLTINIRSVISQKADLDILGYASKVSGFTTLLTETARYYVLTNDIDYENKELVPIAMNNTLAGQGEWGRSDYGTLNTSYANNVFKTTLDGRGHVIKNAYLPSMVLVSNSNPFTFSSFIGKHQGTVKNIGFVNLRTKLIYDESANFNTSCTKAFDYYGDQTASSGLIGINDGGTLENIYLDMKIYKKSYPAGYESGALVGTASSGVIKNCIIEAEKDYNVANFDTNSAYPVDWGAVIGSNKSATTIANVFAVSNLTNYMYVEKVGTTPADSLYTSVSALISAQSSAIAGFGGAWKLEGGQLSFGSVTIS